jgi:toxin ParE1/3/4
MTKSTLFLQSMERNLRWTNRSLGRLDEIAAYIVKDNPTRATTFITELRQKLDVLKSHQLGKAGRVFGTKELVLHQNYLAVYRVKDDEVQIITILHTAQNK